MSIEINWPTKTRDLHNHHFDSTIWDDLQFRDDDIVISTYAKSGTTWIQQIIAQMMFGGDPDLEVAEMSPWVDLRIPPKEVKLPTIEAQTPEPLRAFREEFLERGWEHLDLTDAFQRGARRGEQLFFEVDGHPNIAGYAIVAEALLEILQR